MLKKVLVFYLKSGDFVSSSTKPPKLGVRTSFPDFSFRHGPISLHCLGWGYLQMIDHKENQLCRFENVHLIFLSYNLNKRQQR